MKPGVSNSLSKVKIKKKNVLHVTHWFSLFLPDRTVIVSRLQAVVVTEHQVEAWIRQTMLVTLHQEVIRRNHITLRPAGVYTTTR